MAPRIQPLMKVGALREAYPELKEVLVGMAAAFGKLRGAMVRRTVA